MKPAMFSNYWKPRIEKIGIYDGTIVSAMSRESDWLCGEMVTLSALGLHGCGAGNGHLMQTR
jgi:hypothetical protein